MKHMRIKRMLSAVLALALLAALAVVPGSAAASSSFSDISDPATAVNADVLRLMGVMDGVGGNRFNPSGNLTRAEFCTMVVNFMGKGNEVPLHATRTIFTDVTADHWALGYVNLAASLTVGTEENKSSLITGVGDGRFEPDAKISLAQAATILIRVLEYTTQQAGAVWPQSYMNLAQSIGLTDGVSAGTYDNITRAQAAQLFTNALRCKNGAGTVYYQTLGDKAPKENVVMLAVGVASDDGTDNGAIRTSDGTYLPQAAGARPSALQGRRGALVLNDRKEIVTFVPDDSTSVTITLSGDAQPTYVKAGGTQYTISSSTTVYTADKAEGDTYLNVYSNLKSGTQLTLFSERGKVVAIYAGGSTGASTDAVVVMGSPSVAMFHQLTGGATNFSIQKNRQSISLSEIQPYDVVTYDAMTNTLVVSDLRLTCIYEDASPNAKAPEKVRILGHDFEVLESGWDTIGQFSLGSNVTLLLTADGKVAGMAKPSAQTRSNAMGVVTGGTTAKMFLPNGGTLELTGGRSDLSKLTDCLVTLSSSAKDRLNASRMASGSAAGEFQVSAMKLGSYTVAAGVRIFEQVGSAVTQVDLSALEGTIPAKDIDAYHRNSSGQVDYIVLKAVTGDAYTYGVLWEGEQSGGGDMPYTNRTVTVENHKGKGGTLITGYSFKNGGFGGVVKGYGELDGLSKAASVIELTEIKNVSASDIFISQGVPYVNANGRTYRVSDDVECYKQATREWFRQESGADRLSACRAFSNSFTIYVDPIGEKVRVIVAK